ncbi:MAG: hypothetical protein E6J78_01625 [Deltaproteobacteria bacterium]|nr:MAG: hypothetical protein E6J78_01625 [Deltaproteobacteria bacterium]
MDDRVKYLRRTPALVVALACGCSSSYSPPATTARVIVTTDKTTILNDGVATANITAICTDAAGKAGTGNVNFAAPLGSLAATGVAAGSSIGVALDATGTAKATFTCGVGSDPRCSGGAGVIVTISWSGSTGTSALTVQAPSATDGGGGGPPPPPPGSDGGVSSLTSIALGSVFPSYVIVSGAANAGQNLPGTATATFAVTSGGLPASGASVNFAEAQGESLVTLGATSGTTDAYGNVTLTLTGKAVQGLAHITAWITGSQVIMTLPVLGGPASIMATAFTPSVLGLRGSGIQETGLMTFTITDSLGSPIPGVTVNFTQGQPALVALGHPSVTTDALGHAVADYSAGPEVGVSSIIATVVGGANPAASHAVAVRGAKPSASGFNFSCAKANLPVYTTTSFFEKTECTVRLSDRYGNRVGIPTPVSFAAEAGSISASAVTKAFDYNNPTDPDEGSVTVTFSSDMGNGFSPMDVAPLAAAPTQYPLPRNNPEPSRTNGQLTFNPRDQLVTLIAMVRGEEAFIDTNHNGVYDPTEIFVDQGDPYIDSNDNNVYDGAIEPRFCGGASCAAYNGPNGVWDSDRTIWAPTWVVFSDAPSAVPDPWAPSSCIDYSNNDIADATTASAAAKMIDSWLNTGALGTSYSAALFAPQPGLTLQTFGGYPELDNWGAMGALHFNFDWVRVSATDNTKACGAVGNVCVERLVFGDFDPGYRITAYVSNPIKVPVPPTNGHACGATPTAGTHLSPFFVDFSAQTGPVKSNVTASGTYGF